jgi:anti-anti-sigma regulatory factor
MLNFNFEKSGDLGLLIFDGELTEERISRLKEALMISMHNAEHVVVDFKQVTKIDPVCISLFSLLCKKSKKLKKRLTLIGMQPETYKQMEEDQGDFIHTLLRTDANNNTIG